MTTKPTLFDRILSRVFPAPASRYELESVRAENQRLRELVKQLMRDKEQLQKSANVCWRANERPS